MKPLGERWGGNPLPYHRCLRIDGDTYRSWDTTCVKLYAIQVCVCLLGEKKPRNWGLNFWKSKPQGGSLGCIHSFRQAVFFRVFCLDPWKTYHDIGTPPPFSIGNPSSFMVDVPLSSWFSWGLQMISWHLTCLKNSQANFNEISAPPELNIVHFPRSFVGKICPRSNKQTANGRRLSIEILGCFKHDVCIWLITIPNTTG